MGLSEGEVGKTDGNRLNKTLFTSLDRPIPIQLTHTHTQTHTCTSFPGTDTLGELGGLLCLLLCVGTRVKTWQQATEV